MATLGLTELLILLVLPGAALVIAAFCSALVAYRRVKRLERRLEGPPSPQNPWR